MPTNTWIRQQKEDPMIFIHSYTRYCTVDAHWSVNISMFAGHGVPLEVEVSTNFLLNFTSVRTTQYLWTRYIILYANYISQRSLFPFRLILTQKIMPICTRHATCKVLSIKQSWDHFTKLHATFSFVKRYQLTNSYTYHLARL